jgi:DNA-binding transcriptional ArsR family regulator
VSANHEQDVWVALGDRTRRAIVLLLAAGPMSVGDLAAQLPVTRPAVSQHLKVLKDAGLVSEEAEGTRRIYRLDAAGVAALREQLDDFWDRTLGGFRNVAERSRRGKK